MSVFKPFITSDIVVSPFKVNKTFTFIGDTALTGSGIDRLLGQNSTSSLYTLENNNEYLRYRSVRELYYSNFIYGDDGSPSNTASFNPDGTITGLPYTPSYYNYLSTTLPPSRYFPTGSDEIIGIISVPSNLFGEYIKPGTFHLTYGTSSIYDDGEGNILKNSQKVGDIIYEHGMVLLTNNGISAQTGYGYVTYGSTNYGADDAAFITDVLNATNITCSFDSTLTIHESQFKCTLRENEFNFSQNPTLISGSLNSGIISDFATGSYFNPYITTVGLYNNKKELLAVAKLAQPLPISSITDTNIIINLDL
jgi:hypothetical protein